MAKFCLHKNSNLLLLSLVAPENENFQCVLLGVFFISICSFIWKKSPWTIEIFVFTVKHSECSINISRAHNLIVKGQVSLNWWWRIFQGKILNLRFVHIVRSLILFPGGFGFGAPQLRAERVQPIRSDRLSPKLSRPKRPSVRVWSTWQMIAHQLVIATWACSHASVKSWALDSPLKWNVAKEALN